MKNLFFKGMNFLVLEKFNFQFIFSNLIQLLTVSILVEMFFNKSQDDDKNEPVAGGGTAIDLSDAHHISDIETEIKCYFELAGISTASASAERIRKKHFRRLWLWRWLVKLPWVRQRKLNALTLAVQDVITEDTKLHQRIQNDRKKRANLVRNVSDEVKDYKALVQHLPSVKGIIEEQVAVARSLAQQVYSHYPELKARWSEADDDFLHILKQHVDEVYSRNIDAFTEQAENVDAFTEQAENVDAFTEQAENVDAFTEQAENVDAFTENLARPDPSQLLDEASILTPEYYKTSLVQTEKPHEFKFRSGVTEPYAHAKSVAQRLPEISFVYDCDVGFELEHLQMEPQLRAAYEADIIAGSQVHMDRRIQEELNEPTANRNGDAILNDDGGQTFSERLQEELDTISVEQLAAELNVNPRTVRSWRNGVVPSPENLRKCSEHFNTRWTQIHNSNNGAEKEPAGL